MGIIFHIAIVIAALVISWLQAVENEENPYGKLWNKSHHILWFRSKKNRFHVIPFLLQACLELKYYNKFLVPHLFLTCYRYLATYLV